MNQARIDLALAAVDDKLVDLITLTGKELAKQYVTIVARDQGVKTPAKVVGGAAAAVGLGLTLGNLLYGLDDLDHNMRLADRSNALRQQFQASRQGEEGQARGGAKAKQFDGDLAEAYQAAYMLEALSSAQAQRSYADGVAAMIDGVRGKLNPLAWLHAKDWREAVDGLRGLAAQTEARAEEDIGHPRFVDTAVALAQNPLAPGMVVKAGKAGAIDLIFVIDSTGSMESSIESVKQSATALIEKIAARTKDFRFALVDYKDFPSEGKGASDYPYKARLPFTNDKAAISTAIRDLTVSGGGDPPESLYSALIRAIRTEGLGAWRNGVTKAVMAMTDARAHDPERETGFTSAAVKEAADAVDPAIIYGIAVGPEHESFDTLTTLASLTGGAVFTAPSPDEVVAAIEKVIVAVPTSPPTALSRDPAPAERGSAALPVVITLALAALMLGVVFVAMRRPRAGQLALVGPGGERLPLRAGAP